VISLLVVVVITVGTLAGTLIANWSPRLGLDLAGGLSVVYKPARHVSTADLQETVSILSNRVNGLGVSGATVETQGGQIVVQVPGVKDAKQVLTTIGQTGQLYFRPALCYAPPPSQKAVAKEPPTACTSKYQLVTSNLGKTSTGQLGYPGTPTPALAGYKSSPHDRKTATVLLPGLTGTKAGRYLLGPATLTGRIVKKAVAQQTQLGRWVVNMALTPEGSAAWDKMAQKNFHQVIGIELDGVVQSAPLTQPTRTTFQSFTGNVQISGNFTQQSAQDLALALNYGSLPVKLVPQTTQTVSPTLGHSALVAGLGAGLVGLLLVLLYTIVYYRLLGLVVLSGLLITGALLWVIISALGHTSIAPSFDLAGVTGIIVSIGITVDSYIVYFERLKDETRSGRSIRTSVDRGFQGAWRTVLAADLVSLAAAVVLFFVAVGEVKGFAFFLGLSTLIDIFMTWFFTRPLVILLGRSERFAHGRRMGLERGLAVGAGARASAATAGADK